MEATEPNGVFFSKHYNLGFTVRGLHWRVSAVRSWRCVEGNRIETRDRFGFDLLGWSVGELADAYAGLVREWLAGPHAARLLGCAIARSEITLNRIMDQLRSGERSEAVKAWLYWCVESWPEFLLAAQAALNERVSADCTEIGDAVRRRLGLVRASAAPPPQEPRAVQVGLAACGGARALLAIAEHPSEQVQQVMGQTILLAVRTASLAAFAAGFEAAARQIEQFARATADAVSSAEQVLEETAAEQEN